jgi:predicted alpha/beta hydrolase family esterase
MGVGVQQKVFPVFFENPFASYFQWASVPVREVGNACERVVHEVQWQCVYGIQVAAAACARTFSAFVGAKECETREPGTQFVLEGLSLKQIVIKQATVSLMENCSIVAHALLAPIGLEALEPKKFSDCDPAQPNVFLVHGYLGAEGSWVFIRESLLKAGIKNVFSISLGHPMHSIEEYTEMLRAKIRHVMDFSGNHDVVLVGHSMGCIVSREYQQTLASGDAVRVLSVIALAAPFAGTLAAGKAAWFSQAASQLLPGSVLLQRQQAWKCDGDQTEYVHIVAEEDSTVPMPEALRGDVSGIRIERVPSVGHSSILFSESAAKYVTDTVLSLCLSKK